MLILTNFIYVDHNKPLLISEQPYNINKHGFPQAKLKNQRIFVMALGISRNQDFLTVDRQAEDWSRNPKTPA